MGRGGSRINGVWVSNKYIGRDKNGKKYDKRKRESGNEVILREGKTWLNPEGKPVVTKNKKGEYIYLPYFKKSDKKFDKESNEYKRSLKEYNIKAGVHKDGRVTVTKGGIYSRKQTFKSADAFKKDANKKLDKQIKYNEHMMNKLKNGVLTYGDLDVSSIKSAIRNKTNLKDINKSLSERYEYHRMQVEAAKDMKRRLNQSSKL